MDSGGDSKVLPFIYGLKKTLGFFLFCFLCTNLWDYVCSMLIKSALGPTQCTDLHKAQVKPKACVSIFEKKGMTNSDKCIYISHSHNSTGGGHKSPKAKGLFYCIHRLLYTTYMTGRAVTMKTGPNNAWTLVFNCIYRLLSTKSTTRMIAMMKRGPNSNILLPSALRCFKVWFDRLKKDQEPNQTVTGPGRTAVTVLTVSQKFWSPVLGLAEFSRTGSRLVRTGFQYIIYKVFYVFYQYNFTSYSINYLCIVTCISVTLMSLGRAYTL